MFTPKEIRDRHRSKRWVKEKEAAYAAERYARFKADPELYEHRLKQARESAIIRKWRGEACNAGLKFSGVPRLVLMQLFVVSLLELGRESAKRKEERRKRYEKNRDRSEYYNAIKSDPAKLAALRERRKVYWQSRSDLIKPTPKDQSTRDKINQMSREKYRELMANPEAKEKRRIKQKAWRSTDDGRSRYAGYMAKMRRSNPSIRIAENIRRRINGEVKVRHPNGRTVDLIGMSIKDFATYLQSLWLPGMTWDNYGIGRDKWNIDHKTPCASFNMSSLEEQKKCFHYSNCQPMWFSDNCSKGSKLPDGTRAIRKPSIAAGLTNVNDSGILGHA